MITEESRAEFKGMMRAVKEYVADLLSGLSRRIDELEKREPLKGDKGDSVVGPPGPPGETVIGPQGSPGESIKGDRGEKGESIVGPKGADGRDALQLDILPGVDFSKSYPRNTYARFDGGIIHSFRNTEPSESLAEKCGWEVVVAGISRITVDQLADARSFTVKMQMTGYQYSESTFTLPVMIYREIYKPDSEYKKGDVVTWGGSAWHCQENDPKSPPGKNGEWKLMVKEGQRGKDGKDGERGPEGPKGKDFTFGGRG